MISEGCKDCLYQARYSFVAQSFRVSIVADRNARRNLMDQILGAALGGCQGVSEFCRGYGAAHYLFRGGSRRWLGPLIVRESVLPSQLISAAKFTGKVSDIKLVEAYFSYAQWDLGLCSTDQPTCSSQQDEYDQDSGDAPGSSWQDGWSVWTFQQVPGRQPTGHTIQICLHQHGRQRWAPGGYVIKSWL